MWARAHSNAARIKMWGYVETSELSVIHLSPVITGVLEIISKAQNWLRSLVHVGLIWQYNPLCSIHIYRRLMVRKKIK